MPPPYAGPLIAAMIGCGMRRIAGTTSLMYDIDRIARREKPRSCVFGRNAPVVQVEAGAERRARRR